MKLNGTIDANGKLLLIDRASLNDWISKHKNNNITLTIEVRKKKRSNEQNKYYHGLIVPMVKQGLWDMGHAVTEEETHEFLKSKFNKIPVAKEDTGEVEYIPISTTKLNTAQFEEYLERIRHWALDFLNIRIPLPNEPLSIITAHYDKELQVTIIDK